MVWTQNLDVIMSMLSWDTEVNYTYLYIYLFHWPKMGLNIKPGNQDDHVTLRSTLYIYISLYIYFDGCHIIIVVLNRIQSKKNYGSISVV